MILPVNLYTDKLTASSGRILRQYPVLLLAITYTWYPGFFTRYRTLLLNKHSSYVVVSGVEC